MMLFIETLQDSIINADTNLFLAINQMNHSFFDRFMSVYSGKWVWIPMYASIFYVLLRIFNWKTVLGIVFGLTLTIVFADKVCAELIRPFFERMRPSNLNNPLSSLVHVVDNYRGGSYGFPSCHAANTFGLTFFLFLLFRRYILTLFMLGWAVLTCYSRVYLGVHYPGDLFVGMLVGITGATLMYFIFKRASYYLKVNPQGAVYGGGKQSVSSDGIIAGGQLSAGPQGYFHLPRLMHINAPILIGAVTILGIIIYASLPWAF